MEVKHRRTENFKSRLLLIAIILLAVFTASMILLRLTNNPFYLWIAMISPIAGVLSSFLHGWAYLGQRRVAVFLLVTALGSLFLETFGVATGLLYGHYHYTYRMGPLFLGYTPYLIPLTWFMMLYPAYIMSLTIARQITSAKLCVRQVVIASLGGLIMTSWDLVLDPVMVKQSHWVWETDGLYFGIPLLNYLGWWLTSFLILMVFQWFDSKVLHGHDSPQTGLERLSNLIYLIIGMGNITGAMITGLWGPAWIALGAIGFWTIVFWIGQNKHEQINSV